MGWRSTQAAVASGAKSFAPKKDVFGEGFLRASEIIAKGMIRTAEQEKADKKEADKLLAAEEKLRLKEEKAARDKLKADQDKKETEAKKMKENAIILAQTFSGEPNNQPAISFFHQQLTLQGGDVGKVMTTAENMITGKRLNFTSKEVTLPFQGPVVPDNPLIEDFDVGFKKPNEAKDGETEAERRKRELGFGNITKFGGGKDIRLDDLEGIINNPNASESDKKQAIQMKEMFGSLSEGTPLPDDATFTETGIEIIPFGQEPFELDYQRLGSLSDIDLYEAELLDQGVTLTEKQENAIAKEKKKLVDTNLSTKIRNLTGKMEEIDLEVRILENNKQTGTDEYTAIKALQTSEREGLKPWEALTSPEVFATLSLEEMIKNRRIAMDYHGATAEDLAQIDKEIATQTTSQNNFASLIEPEKLIGKNVEELQTIRRLAIAKGAKEEDLLTVKAEIDRANTIKDLGEYRVYAEKATNASTTQQQISIALREGVSNETLSGLRQLLAIQTKIKDKNIAAETMGFNVQSLDAEITDADGTKRYGVVYLKPGESQPTDSKGDPVNAVPLTEAQAKAFGDIRTETQKIMTELGVASSAVTEGMITAASAVDIVEQDERVSGAGGKLAKFLSSTGRSTGQILSIAEELFVDNETVTLEQIQEKGGFNNDFADAILTGDVQSLGDATARFEAKMLSLAFQVGRMEGQSGNAMSNQDFRKIMEIVRTSGGSAQAFKTNLMEYMNGKIESYDRKLFTATGAGSQIGGFKELYGWSPVSEPLNMKDYVAAVNQPSLTSAYSMFSGTEIEVTTRPPKPQSNDGLPVPTTQAQRDALSNTWYVAPDGNLAWKGN